VLDSLHALDLACAPHVVARLVAQGKSLGDLVEQDVPTRIVLYAPVVTAENVDEYLPTAFAS